MNKVTYNYEKEYYFISCEKCGSEFVVLAVLREDNNEPYIFGNQIPKSNSNSYCFYCGNILKGEE